MHGPDVKRVIIADLILSHNYREQWRSRIGFQQPSARCPPKKKDALMVASTTSGRLCPLSIGEPYRRRHCPGKNGRL
jgi:hypothetical protein